MAEISLFQLLIYIIKDSRLNFECRVVQAGSESASVRSLPAEETTPLELSAAFDPSDALVIAANYHKSITQTKTNALRCYASSSQPSSSSTLLYFSASENNPIFFCICFMFRLAIGECESERIDYLSPCANASAMVEWVAKESAANHISISEPNYN